MNRCDVVVVVVTILLLLLVVTLLMYVPFMYESCMNTKPGTHMHQYHTTPLASGWCWVDVPVP